MKNTTNSDEPLIINPNRKSDLLLAKELVTSEIRYRRLFESAKDGILILDAETGKIVDVNPFLIDLLGYTKLDFIEKSIWEIGAFKDIYANKEKFLELQQKKYVRYDDLPLQTSTGRKIHVEFVSNVYLEDRHEVIQCNIRDITERTNIQNEIKFQAELINNVGQAIIATDLLGKVIYWNHAAEKIYGWSYSEAIGQNIIHLTPAQQSNEQAIEIMKKLNEGKTWAGEFLVKRKDGSSFPAFVTDTPIFGSNGKLTGIIGISSDITERKRTEKELKKSEEKFKMVFENVFDGISIYTDDPDPLKRILVDCNERYAAMAGRSRDELLRIGRTLELQTSFDDNANENRLNSLISGKEYYGSFSWIRPDKKENIIEYVGMPITWQGESYTIGIDRDITERKHAEKELFDAKEKAEESDRLKSAFLANMSHEIRTPMNGILGFTELLKNLKLKGEEQQEYIRIIEKSGTRMLNIINDIISISKIESHQVRIVNSDTNINVQVEYIYRFFKLEAEQKNLHFSIKNRLPDEEAVIKTDREKVYAILTNLVKNAMKFTKNGFVEMGCLKKEGFLQFHIKDSGPGIPEEQKGIIFERFRQGSEELTRNYEGAGLGLSISKAYVEMLGGKIWVENNAGFNGNTSGATFFFTIPVIPVKETKPIIQAAKSEKTTNNEPLKLNILIVENDEISEFLMIKMVEAYSGKILKATTGVEAVEVCRKNHDIDLILMDINMQEMDGYEATREIREFNKDVVIIAQTAYAMAGDREKSIAAGCNNYISKPIKRADLRKMVNIYFSALSKV